MNPVLVLAAGAAIGMLGLRLGRQGLSSKTVTSAREAGQTALRKGYTTAEKGLRGAAVTSLATIGRTSDTLRHRLATDASETEAEAEAEADVLEPKPAKKPRRRSSTKSAAETNDS